MVSVKDALSQLSAELKRRNYTVDRFCKEGEDTLRVGIGGVSLIDYSLDDTDLDRTVTSMADEVHGLCREYLKDKEVEDVLELDDEGVMNPVISKFIKKNNVLRRTETLVQSDKD